MLEALLEAKALMMNALQILDRSNASLHIGAQLDLAINSLSEECLALADQAESTARKTESR